MSSETLNIDPSLEEVSSEQLLAVIGQEAGKILTSINRASNSVITHVDRKVGLSLTDLSAAVNDSTDEMKLVVERLGHHQQIIASLVPLLKFLSKVPANTDVLCKSAELVFQKERQGLEDDILKKLRASTTVENESMDPVSEVKRVKRDSTREVGQF